MKRLVLAFVAALTFGTPASAAVMTRTYSFTGSGFAAGNGATSPVAAVAGSVTVSFDPAVSAADLPGATVNTLGVPFHSPISVSYDSGRDTLVIASADFPPQGRGTGAFALTIRNASADQRLLGGTFSYAADGDDRVLIAQRVKIAPTAAPARLPEPATWAMLVMGFGLIGWVARRHQRRSEAAFTERMKRIASGEVE